MLINDKYDCLCPVLCFCSTETAEKNLHLHQIPPLSLGHNKYQCVADVQKTYHAIMLNEDA